MDGRLEIASYIFYKVHNTKWLIYKTNHLCFNETFGQINLYYFLGAFIMLGKPTMVCVIYFVNLHTYHNTGQYFRYFYYLNCDRRQAFCYMCWLYVGTLSINAVVTTGCLNLGWFVEKEATTWTTAKNRCVSDFRLVSLAKKKMRFHQLRLVCSHFFLAFVVLFSLAMNPVSSSNQVSQ